MSLRLISAKACDTSAERPLVADGALVSLVADYEVLDMGPVSTLGLPLRVSFTSKGVTASMTLEAPTQKDVPAALEKLAEWLERAARGIRESNLKETPVLPVGE